MNLSTACGYVIVLRKLYLLYKTRTAQILCTVSVWMVLELPLLCRRVPEGVHVNLPVHYIVRERVYELAGPRVVSEWHHLQIN